MEKCTNIGRHIFYFQSFAFTNASLNLGHGKTTTAASRSL
jgi:hypothetical protein